ncbi:phosphoribosylformylglycinamidine synthase subunit PurL [Candidatus Woesearchaeota archaeon]|nr:phosphoribosylformylglycinamidine synthase subunit PurL [Candidatus Woesearchaeota archaeon]
MGDIDINTINLDLSDKELSALIKENGLGFSIEEIKKLPKILGRDPTITELHIFNTQWSEHSSYKSSKDILKQLPTEGPTVILGPKEDAGIALFTEWQGDKYGIAMSHESHNHPSQVIPFEGAATGIGGNVRDVLCMGARVIACGDPLRFGNPFGKNKNRTKYIASQVIEGIAGYGNPLGVPVICGDVYFNESFDDNCLVNVITLGLIKEKEIIHSHAPKDAEGFDIIIVGKATDNSGFGGTTFASVILDEDDRESNRGAVQVPDPFLKNVLFRATEAVFKIVREKNIPVGFKDMGAGGIMCATTELTSSACFGADIDIDKIHVSMHNLPPYMITCSETQERFTWICPKDFTPTILKIYNEDFDLPSVSEGAKASVVGTVTKENNYVLRHKGKIICNADVNQITQGIKYKRESRQKKYTGKEPSIAEPDYKDMCLKVLSHPTVASKLACYKHYDTEVQGLAVIRAGEADAGVQAPIDGCPAGLALSADANPRYALIDPKQAAINAVAESMRNVAAVGAVPIAMTDCLNFGNPEKPEQFAEFTEAVKGLAEATSRLHLKGTQGPVPFIGGNVSFYNESAAGKSVAPSPVVACLGKLEDVSKAITMKIKKENSTLFLVGERKDELGGSVYYELHDHLGKNVPEIDYEKEKKMIHSIIDAIEKKLILSCHDISDGGLLTTVAEMMLGGEADGKIGASINLDFSSLPLSKILFSESSGFVFEVDNGHIPKIKKMFPDAMILGETGGSDLRFTAKDKQFRLSIEEMKKAWTSGFTEALQ